MRLPMSRERPNTATPADIEARMLQRSQRTPASGETTACASIPMEKAAAVAPRLQPSSPEISLKKGPMVARKAMSAIMAR